ncbi:MAG: hypothetical protein OQJ89_14475 [Kangiellaceae bacterium]|nr:hypothetical protein [Kangiellaceae bacterium]MCW9018172.1 hypothetical protein [Kangiellaceae bacterium]
MKNFKKILIPTIFLFSLPVLHAEEYKSVEKLSNELRVLLQQEMRAIESGMKDIVSANAHGDTELVASIAGNIKNSFILKQKLTKQQKHELHEKLPGTFLEKDKQFHYYAGMLEHVAKNNKQELVSFYYSKLVESCSSCHQAHAQHRFPKFIIGAKEQAEHSHDH